MYVDKENAEDYIGLICYKTFDPKKLYVIDSVAKTNDVDVIFNVRNIKGEQSTISSLTLKCINTLIEDTETKLKNHQARLWNFKKKLGIDESV